MSFFYIRRVISTTVFLVTLLSLSLPTPAKALTFTEIVNSQTGKIPKGQVLGAVTPSLPLVYLDTTYQASVSGTCTVTVASGGNVQAAIDAATQTSNYVICLQAGGTFAPFKLKNKSGSGWITIRTSTPDSQFPAPGNRVSSSQSSLLAKILPSGGQSYDTPITTESSAHNYRLIGLEVTTPNIGTQYTVYNMIEIGNIYTDNTESLTPTDIIVDRSYLHGTATGNIRRGVTLNGRRLSVIDSYISDIHEVGADSQAVGSWNGSGPFKIVNNYLEASGENIMFGGSMPAVSGLVASDIEIRNNYVYKPLTWKIGHASYAGINWTVKNLFELKNARRVLINGNIFENNWYHAQRGEGIVFTVRTTQAGPQAVVEDVTFTNNIVRRVDRSFMINGFDDEDPLHGGFTRRILIKNNLFDKTAWSEECCIYQIIIQNKTTEVEIDHNTFVEDRVVGVNIATTGEQSSNVYFTNNIIPLYNYGMDAANGPATCANCVYNKNIFSGDNQTPYTPPPSSLYYNNYFPGPWSAVSMINRSGGDFRLLSSSPYKNIGSDGKDPGADIEALNAATANVNIGGSSQPYTPPAPPADTTAPVISSISTNSVTQTSAGITWSTDESSDTQVDYGLTTSYGLSTTLNASGVTSHTATLSGLTAGTLYHYRVKSRDTAGNIALSSDQTVTTTAIANIPATINTISANFGSQTVGSSTSALMLTINNPSSIFVGVGTIAITGDFAISLNSCAVGTQPQTHCDVYVVFTPTAAGTRTGTITFPLTGNTVTSLQATLTGSGVSAPSEVVPPTPTPTTPSTPATPTSPTPTSPQTPPVVPSSNILLPPNRTDGQVIKFNNNPTLYLVKPDGLHPFDSYASYVAYTQTRPTTIVTTEGGATDFTTSAILAKDILGQTITPQTPAAGQGLFYRTGTLLNDTGTIYLIIGQTKVPFTSLNVFQKLGYKLKDVVKGDSASYSLSQSYFLNSTTMAHPWSSWLLLNKTIYYATEQGMLPVPTMDIFTSNGGELSKVLPMNQADKLQTKIRALEYNDPVIIK